jgi:hypothetical protein
MTNDYKVEFSLVFPTDFFLACKNISDDMNTFVPSRKKHSLFYEPSLLLKKMNLRVSKRQQIKFWIKINVIYTWEVLKSFAESVGSGKPKLPGNSHYLIYCKNFTRVIWHQLQENPILFFALKRDEFVNKKLKHVLNL